MVLFIEYDVETDGMIEVVGLINAIEENGGDPEGEEWMAWRASFDDGGMGCVSVSPSKLSEMEAAGDPEALRSTVERIILADRREKEGVK
jgi:hypothetical protein